MNLKKLQTQKETKIEYSKKQMVLSNGINNIAYNIEELYNTQNKEYYYVLNLQKHPLTDNQNEMKIVPYNIFKFSVGALPNQETNSFDYLASSPVWIKFDSSYVNDGAYYLFRSPNAIAAKAFQVEGIFVNAIPVGNKKIGEETYRFIFNEKKGAIYE